MSFSKRSDVAPVCYSKPLDSVKNWNDHFFYVDSAVFPLPVPLNKSKTLNLFSFIRHPNPTKVLIRERERAEGEPKLLTMTEGHIVPLDVPKFVVKKTKKPKQKRKVTEDASGSTHPPKKLREDYHAAPSNAGGKSLAAIRGLVPEGSSVLSDVAKPRVVTPTSDAGPTNSVSRLNLRTRPPGARYVISSDYSPYSGSHSKAKSFVRSPVADALVVTVAVTTTVAANVYTIPIPRVRVESKNLDNIGDFASDGGANTDTASVSKLHKASTSSDSFYASQSLDTETMHRIYVPMLTMANDSILKDLESKISHLKSLLSLKEAKAAKAIRLRGQLAAVEAADIVKGNELMDLKEKFFALEGEKDVMSDKVTSLEFATATKDAELASLSLQVSQLTSDLSSFQLSRDELCSKVSSLESERDSVANQKSSLESAFELFKEQMEAMQDEQATTLANRVAELDAQLLKMAAHLEEEFYPRFLTTISGRWWILTHGLKLVLFKCLQSTEYIRVLGEAIGCAINKGMQDGLRAGIDHGKARRDLSVIKAYDPSAEAKMVDLMDSLRLEGPLAKIPGAEELQPSLEQLMLLIHKEEDDVVLGETSLSFCLQASTSANPAAAEAITTLSTTFASSNVVPPLSVSDYQFSDVEPHNEDPPTTTFEKGK
ncbi:hypothetical protein Tco_0784747 [Tanacetum coccineum]